VGTNGTATGGDRAAFDEFVRAEIGALTWIAYLLTGDAHHAEDLVQMSLTRVATHWHRIDDPPAYARRVVYTQSATWWRHRRRRHDEFLTWDLPDRAAPDPPEPEIALVLRDALARLTARQRAVLVLRYFEDCSEAETAARLNCRAFRDPATDRVRLVELVPNAAAPTTLLETPSGISEVDVAADLAIRGTFRDAGEPDYGRPSMMLVYVAVLGSVLLGLVGLVLLLRRRTRKAARAARARSSPGRR
jgi:RNA polymerase sigma factor (sigma-70 family)